MWELVRKLREGGTTIILTTHYIEEAEEMADRVGVINQGELILVEEKHALMQKLGRKVLHLQLAEPLADVPPALADWQPRLSDNGNTLTYEFDAKAERTGIPSLLSAMRDAGIGFKDLDTKQSSLEDIFVGLIHEKRDDLRSAAK
jgi:ABC-2 type transport system ATP-binding protein